MIPSDPIPRQQTDFRSTVSENIEDVISGELMTQAVTLFPCGHTFNKDTVIQCLARNKLCPLDRKVIERHAPNYTIRQLAEAAESHPLEEFKHDPIEEAVKHFLRAKQYAEKGNHEAAVEALLQSLRLSPTYEKAQAYLEFCLKRSEKSSSSSKLPSLCREKGKEKMLCSADSFKEGYIELLFNLLEEPQIQINPALKKMLEKQVEELIRQEGEELTEDEKISYQWTKNLLGENKKVRQFTLEKLQQIHQRSYFISDSPLSILSVSSAPALSLEGMNSLYKEIINLHFPYEEGNSAEHAYSLDQIYKIDFNLSVEAKLKHIFKQVLTWVESLSPLEFKGENKKNDVFDFLTYASYLLNISRLLLWEELPGGREYLDQEKIKMLPLKRKGALFKDWLKEHGKNVTYLSFKRRGFITKKINLTFLPAEIGQLVNLKTLDLQQNSLTSLPPEIGQLSNLQNLYLSSNQLTALPVEIGQLSQLQDLSLSNNQLTVLPVKIG
ncbi:leucine-rich repeat domain-containing protein [Neochlamydia sp. AcF95]|uniref:leucine-rich repeat domain-containing protein n=1 Tax=Neochlamydia sp. AcF95 TaxID=2795734 RepID=UPI001BC9C08A|nr:leucine-rich repeat domain-containing protein [Neochlamydia sp. AcF95]MBS4171081.1 hypothetical protein [Neochlamydia sp. AcF95]